MEAPAVRRDYPVLRPLQGMAQDRGGTGEDEDARAQERESGHALLGVLHLRGAHPRIRARLLHSLLILFVCFWPLFAAEGMLVGCCDSSLFDRGTVVVDTKGEAKPATYISTKHYRGLDFFAFESVS